jgi:hypothetical protein
MGYQTVWFMSRSLPWSLKMNLINTKRTSLWGIYHFLRIFLVIFSQLNIQWWVCVTCQFYIKYLKLFLKKKKKKEKLTWQGHIASWYSQIYNADLWHLTQSTIYKTFPARLWIQSQKERERNFLINATFRIFVLNQALWHEVYSQLLGRLRQEDFFFFFFLQY